MAENENKCTGTVSDAEEVKPQSIVVTVGDTEEVPLESTNNIEVVDIVGITPVDFITRLANQQYYFADINDLCDEFADVLLEEDDDDIELPEHLHAARLLEQCGALERERKMMTLSTTAASIEAEEQPGTNNIQGLGSVSMISSVDENEK